MSNPNQPPPNQPQFQPPQPPKYAPFRRGFWATVGALVALTLWSLIPAAIFAVIYFVFVSPGR